MELNNNTLKGHFIPMEFCLNLQCKAVSRFLIKIILGKYNKHIYGKLRIALGTFSFAFPALVPRQIFIWRMKGKGKKPLWKDAPWSICLLKRLAWKEQRPKSASFPLSAILIEWLYLSLTMTKPQTAPRPTIVAIKSKQKKWEDDDDKK